MSHSKVLKSLGITDMWCGYKLGDMFSKSSPAKVFQGYSTKDMITILTHMRNQPNYKTVLATDAKCRELVTYIQGTIQQTHPLFEVAPALHQKWSLYLCGSKPLDIVKNLENQLGSKERAVLEALDFVGDIVQNDEVFNSMTKVQNIAKELFQYFLPPEFYIPAATIHNDILMVAKTHEARFSGVADAYERRFAPRRERPSSASSSNSQSNSSVSSSNSQSNTSVSSSNSQSNSQSQAVERSAAPDALRGDLQASQFHPSHLTKKVTLPQLPPSPRGFNLSQEIQGLFNQVDGVFPQMITDDRSMRTKENLIFNLRDLIEQTYNEYALDQTNSDIYRMLVQTVLAFKQRKADIDKEAGNKDSLILNYQRDVRTFLMVVGVAFYHCIDRKVNASQKMYFQFVEKDPNKFKQVAEKTMEASVLEQLLFFRRDLVDHICTQLIDTNMHHASTERFVKKSLNEEFNLQYPNLIMSENNAQFYAQRELVNEARKIFLREYTPQKANEFIQKFLKDSMSKSFNYQAMCRWFKENGNHSMQDVYDAEALAFKPNAMHAFYKKMNIIS